MDLQTSLHVYRVNGRNELNLPFVGRPCRAGAGRTETLRLCFNCALLFQLYM